jgi:hypothetical protein
MTIGIVARTRERIRSNERILTSTHRRIRVSRRVLYHPGFVWYEESRTFNRYEALASGISRASARSWPCWWK